MRSESPPPEVLSHGEDTLQSSMEGFRSALLEERERLVARLEASLGDPRRVAFEEAQAAHIRLLRELAGGTEDNGPLCRPYREGVRSRVLEPLLESLRELDPGEEVRAAWEEFRSRLATRARELPEEILRGEPEDLYRARKGEGPLTAGMKGIVRGWRGVLGGLARMEAGLQRLLRRPGRAASPRFQRVPLRELAGKWVAGRLALSLGPLEDALQRHYATPQAHLAWAAARWSGAWPRTEAGEERPFAPGLPESLSRFFPPRDPPDESRPAEETEDEKDSPAPRLRMEELGEGLGEALGSGATLGAPAEVSGGIGAVFERAWVNLSEEIRVSGSFQASSSAAREGARALQLFGKGRRRAGAWSAWNRGNLERVQLAIILLLLRKGFDDARDEMAGRVGREGLEPLLASWLRARTDLADLLREVGAAFSSHSAAEGPEAMVGPVDRFLEKAQGILKRELVESPLPQEASEVVRRAADEASEKLADGLRVLPRSLSLPATEDTDELVEPVATNRELLLREIAQKAVDVLRLEEVRNAPTPVLDYLEGVAARTEEIFSVATFNLTAARDELANPPEGTPEAILGDARSLSVDGLARTAKGVEELIKGVLARWEESVREVNRHLNQSFQEIHTRAVAEGAVQEQMLDLQARLRLAVRWGLGALREGLEGVERRTRRLTRRVVTALVRIVRLGRSAVGSPTDQEGEAERALETLRSVPSLLEGLPLVYRRLFPFQPVTDSSILVGREWERKWVARRLGEWRGGFGVPLVLTGSAAGGYSSLLNSLSSKELEGFRIVRLEFKERLDSSEAVAGVLAGALGLEVAASPINLEALSHEILRQSVGEGGPTAVLVEHLEHLVTRIPGGTDLVAEFFSLQARTAKEIFWMSTLPGATWKFVEKSEPRATGLVAQGALRPLTAADLEALIMARHRRSGMPVEFLQPTDLNPLLRRKIRLARSEDARQDMLRRDCFERIHRMCDGSIGMAILSWLRGADFTSREGWLRITPPRPIRFAFLETMDLEMDFALKAFLEHGSLTLREYSSIFHAPREEAYQIFEALRSRLLLDPVGSQSLVPTGSQGIRDEERYRVPGLLSQVVAARLKNRNILH